MHRFLAVKGYREFLPAAEGARKKTSKTGRTWSLTRYAPTRSRGRLLRRASRTAADCSEWRDPRENLHTLIVGVLAELRAVRRAAEKRPHYVEESHSRLRAERTHAHGRGIHSYDDGVRQGPPALSCSGLPAFASSRSGRASGPLRQELAYVADQEEGWASG